MTTTRDQLATGEVSYDDYLGEFRITGTVHQAVARGVNPHIDIPLFTQVKGNLWQGGCMQGVCLPDTFKYVFSLYPWEKYDLAPGTERVEFQLYDSLDQSTDEFEDIARQVHDAASKGKTLVHCQAGLNRSGAVAARVLMLDGMSAADALSLLREQRSPLVVCNKAFEDYLLGLDA